MTTNRGRTEAVKALVLLHGPGGFSLPADLLTAYEIPAKVRAVPLPSPAPFDARTAADEMLHQLERGETPDLAELSRRVSDNERANVDVMTAQRVAADALEQAENVVLGVIGDTADQVIIACIRPVFEANLERARKHGEALTGQPLDPMALITAPARTRTAWAALNDCASQYVVQRRARRLVNVAGLREQQHDVEDQFAMFEHPYELFPGVVPGQTRMPPLPVPADGVELMLWLTGPAAPARPWLPTASEQDAAWYVVHGEAAEMRRQIHSGAWPAVRGRAE